MTETKERLVDSQIAAVVERCAQTADRRLPTERQLAEQLGVGRSTVRRALERLEAEGRVWRHVGRGTFAGPRPAAADENLALLSRFTSPSELIEARLLLEPMLAGLAAARATPAEIEAMRLLVRRCATASSYDAYEVFDEKLHLAIAEAAGNQLLLAIYRGVNSLRKEVFFRRTRDLVLAAERREANTVHHDAVVDAIEARDVEAARTAMRRHIKSFEDRYLALD